MKQFAIVFAVTGVLMSLVSFVAYGFDKYRAKRNGWRVPEKTLHIIAVFGGWPGAMLAQRMFRDKTQKASFRLVFWICVVSNLLLLGCGVYLTRAM